MTDASNPIPQITREHEAAGSGDLVAGNIVRLKALFPEIVTDGQVDFDVLRELLGDAVEDGEERYGLNWKGKRKARAFALTPSLGTLRPASGDSVDWNSTQNIVIEGDNLEVLKLLRRSYAAKVKLIYIDPPYNTGGDFVYPDNYRNSLGSYLGITGQLGEVGEALTSNKEASGRFHTDWLNMIYPRLTLARELMSENGVIFISIGEAESGNLRSVLDDVFGAENFIANICHKARASVSNDKIVSASHNFVILYARDASTVFAERAKFGLAPNLEGFDLVDEKGPYKLTPVDGPGGAAKGNPYYTFQGVTGYFRYSLEEMGRRWDAGRIVKAGNGLQQKYYRADAEASRKTDTTWWDDGLYTSTATAQLKALMGEDVFSNPKHVALIERMIELWARDDGDIVLDFFAGSGTTGHASFRQSATDGVLRRAILVQLPEPLDPGVAQQKLAAEYCRDLGKPLTIAELTKERLRRAGAKIREEHPEAKVDTGFRVYKLATSNLKPWQPDAEDLEASILDAVDNVLPGRTEDDLLVELLLKTGIDLTLPEEKRSIAGQTVHALGGGTLMVCLGNVDANDAEALGQGMADCVEELDPVQTTVYFKDTGLGADGNRAATKANLAAILRQRLGDRIAKIASI